MTYMTDVTPIITAAEAVQALIEAIQPLERTGSPEVREAIARRSSLDDNKAQPPRRSREANPIPSHHYG